MALTPDEILKELFDTIDNSIEKITDKATEQQKSILQEVELLIKDLSLDENGNIKSTIGNLKLINKINIKLEKVILTPEYKKSVAEFAKSFGEVEDLQNRYYRDVFNEFEVPKTSEELKNIAVQTTIKDLTEAGLNTNVSTAISDLISSNIKGKQSFDSLRTQLKDFILGTKEKNGRLLSYVNQITSDSLNTYSAEYDKIITDVIQPQWFKYVGSIILDSRPFCKAVVEKKWVHKSELGALSRGEVDGEKVSTQGFKPNTDKENIIINRGGWNCRHKFVAVSEEVVPDKIKAKFAEEKPKVEEPQIVKFVPAKNIKEAEEYAKTFANNVYFKGANLDSVNIINSRLNELYNEFNIDKLDKLNNSITKGRANAHANGQILEYSKKLLSQPPVEISESALNYKETIKNNLEQFLQAKKDRPELFIGNGTNAKNNRKALKDLEEGIKFERWSTSSGNIDKTTTHEFAHILEYQFINKYNGIKASSTFDKTKGKLTEKDSNEIINEWDSIYNKIIKSEDKYKISEYSLTNKSEMFAETFTMYYFERNKLPKYIKDFFDITLDKFKNYGN